MTIYNAHGHTPALAGGARELHFPTFEKVQFVTALGIIFLFKRERICHWMMPSNK
jgi:hypothetical protein